MVAVEWPIAGPDDDGEPAPPRARGGGRLPVVRADFFLDDRARLTEQERALMRAMLTDLIDMIADEFVALLPDSEPANDDGEKLIDRLWGSGLLDIPDLLRLLLRRAEEERISAGVRSAQPAERMRFLQSLVSDDDPAISAAAMALILARGRRRDRFDGPRIAFDDLPAEAAVALVNAVAAALRSDLVKRLPKAEADERLARAARELLSRHDEGNRLEARLFDLVHALERATRLDDRLVRSALAEGDVALLAETLARRTGTDFGASWAQLGGAPAQLALLLRMARLSRELAGEVIATLAELVGSNSESEIQAFDSLDQEEVDSAGKWLRLDPSYRDAIAILSKSSGQRAL
jgi:hypothetical protein